MCINNTSIAYLSFVKTSISIECMAGFYGDVCSNSCGHCLNNTACHHVTGICDQGCESGYRAPNCSIGMIQLKYKIYILFSYSRELKKNEIIQ